MFAEFLCHLAGVGERVFGRGEALREALQQLIRDLAQRGVAICQCGKRFRWPPID